MEKVILVSNFLGRSCFLRRNITNRVHRGYRAPVVGLTRNTASSYSASHSASSGLNHPQLLHPSSYHTTTCFSSSPASIGVSKHDISRDEALHPSVGNTSLVEKINNVVDSVDTGRLFAVIQIASKQRKITTEDIIIVEGTFMADIGDRLKLEKVLVVGSKDFTLIGRPMLNPDLVRIEATVIEKTLSHSKVKYSYRARKRNQRFVVKQYFHTMLQINSIELTRYNSSKSSVTHDT